jgi:C_GCAxxG_C_C family probable redox protein
MRLSLFSIHAQSFFYRKNMADVISWRQHCDDEAAPHRQAGFGRGDRIMTKGRRKGKMNRADRAEELFRQGYNCSQSVFAAFADAAGLTTEEAAKIASPFGAGFGKMREVCGAVSGLTLLAGYLQGYSDPDDYDSKKELYALIQKMCGEFREKEGTMICRELLGLKEGEDLPEPSVRTEEYYRSRPCIRACRTAAEIAEKHLL